MEEDGFILVKSKKKKNSVFGTKELEKALLTCSSSTPESFDVETFVRCEGFFPWEMFVNQRQKMDFLVLEALRLSQKSFPEADISPIVWPRACLGLTNLSKPL